MRREILYKLSVCSDLGCVHPSAPRVPSFVTLGLGLGLVKVVCVD